MNTETETALRAQASYQLMCWRDEYFQHGPKEFIVSCAVGYAFECFTLHEPTPNIYPIEQALKSTISGMFDAHLSFSAFSEVYARMIGSAISGLTVDEDEVGEFTIFLDECMKFFIQDMKTWMNTNNDDL